MDSLSLFIGSMMLLSLGAQEPQSQAYLFEPLTKKVCFELRLPESKRNPDDVAVHWRCDTVKDYQLSIYLMDSVQILTSGEYLDVRLQLTAKQKAEYKRLISATLGEALSARASGKAGHWSIDMQIGPQTAATPAIDFDKTSGLADYIQSQSPILPNVSGAQGYELQRPNVGFYDRVFKWDSLIVATPYPNGIYCKVTHGSITNAEGTRRLDAETRRFIESYVGWLNPRMKYNYDFKMDGFIFENRAYGGATLELDGKLIFFSYPMHCHGLPTFYKHLFVTVAQNQYGDSEEVAERARAIREILFGVE